MYTHPLDPRILRTKLPSEDDLFMYYDLDTKDGQMKNKLVIHTARNNGTFITDFDQYGQIKRLTQTMDDDYQSHLMILVSRGCVVRVCKKSHRGKKTVLKRVNLCYPTNRSSKESKSVSTTAHTLDFNIKHLERFVGLNAYTNYNVTVEHVNMNVNAIVPRTTKNPRGVSHSGDNRVKVYMKVKSCGMETIEGDASVEIHAIDNSGNISERISVPVLKENGGTLFFFLPNITEEHSDRLLDEKCSLAFKISQDMCLSALLYSANRLCGNLSSDHVGSTSDRHRRNSYNITGICLNLVNSIAEFCKVYTIESTQTGTNCSELFNEAQNIFQDDVLILYPKVTLSGGRVINGLPNRISLLDISLSGYKEIIIEDDKPAFKLTSISIVPADPLPLDLYQVRIDYKCATNYTVIDMRIRGSDQYTNYAVCAGINSCHCCVLHAAGASGSVVDNVEINVTDTWTGTNIVKEVVVIF